LWTRFSVSKKNEIINPENFRFLEIFGLDQVEVWGMRFREVEFVGLEKVAVGVLAWGGKTLV